LIDLSINIMACFGYADAWKDYTFLRPQGLLRRISTVSRIGKKAASGDRADVRRQQLIEATITVIGRKGYVGTRMADVARQADVSYGVVGFYFKTKNDLLLATLQWLADEYTQVWRNAVAKAGPDPAARLRAIIDADFSSKIASQKKIAVWYAFWAEARTRASYRKYSPNSTTTTTGRSAPSFRNSSTRGAIIISMAIASRSRSTP
jgi:AcrR family transcriptional regulator